MHATLIAPFQELDLLGQYVVMLVDRGEETRQVMSIRPFGIAAPEEG